MTMIFILQGKK
uniref:Uncharacterized protein n=1 Tax=Arundo donax TaxID=35708 RepID=A0A0A8ZWZ7_ARUDO